MKSVIIKIEFDDPSHHWISTVHFGESMVTYAGEVDLTNALKVIAEDLPKRIVQEFMRT